MRYLYSPMQSKTTALVDFYDGYNVQDSENLSNELKDAKTFWTAERNFRVRFSSEFVTQSKTFHIAHVIWPIVII